MYCGPTHQQQVFHTVDSQKKPQGNLGLYMSAPTTDQWQPMEGCHVDRTHPAAAASRCVSASYRADPQTGGRHVASPADTGQGAARHPDAHPDARLLRPIGRRHVASPNLPRASRRAAPRESCPCLRIRVYCLEIRANRLGIHATVLGSVPLSRDPCQLPRDPCQLPRDPCHFLGIRARCLEIRARTVTSGRSPLRTGLLQ